MLTMTLIYVPNPTTMRKIFPLEYLLAILTVSSCKDAPAPLIIITVVKTQPVVGAGGPQCQITETITANTLVTPEVINKIVGWCTMDWRLGSNSEHIMNLD